MLDNRAKKILHSSFFSFLFKGLVFAFNISFIGIMTRTFSKEACGFWVVITQLSMLLGMMDLGICGSPLRNVLTKLKTEGNENLAKRYFISFFCLTSLLYILFVLLIVGVGFFISWEQIFHFEDVFLSQNLSSLLLTAVLGTSCKLLFSIAGTGFLAFYEAHIKIVFDALEILIGCFLALFFYKKGGDLLSFTKTYFIWGACIACASWLLFFVRRKWRFQWISLKDMVSLLRPFWSTSLFFWIQNVLILLVFSLIATVIGIKVGLEEAAEYALIQRVFTALIGVHYVVLNPLWTGYTEAFSLKDYRWIKKAYKKSLLLTALFFTGSLPIIYLITPQAVFLWSGRWIDNNLLIIAVGIWTFLYAFINCQIVLLSSMNEVKKQVVFLGFSYLVFLLLCLTPMCKSSFLLSLAASIALGVFLCGLIFETKKVLASQTLRSSL